MGTKIKIVTEQGVETQPDEDIIDSQIELIERIKGALDENDKANSISSAIVEDLVYLDFQCESVNADGIFNVVENLMKSENFSLYYLDVAEEFSDGTALCTIKISI